MRELTEILDFERDLNGGKALPPEQQWWEPIPGETLLQFQAFLFYRDCAKKPRTLAAAYLEWLQEKLKQADTPKAVLKLEGKIERCQKKGKAGSHFSRWSAQNHWRSRSETLDTAIFKYESCFAAYQRLEERKALRQADLDLCKSAYDLVTEALQNFEIRRGDTTLRIGKIYLRDVVELYKVSRQIRVKTLGDSYETIEAIVKIVEAGILPPEAMSAIIEWINEIDFSNNPKLAGKLREAIAKSSA